MTLAELKKLYDYNYWANEIIYDMLARLPEDVFTNEVGGSFGSVRNTLAHMMSAEWGWMGRCGGPERPAKLQAEDYPTLQALRDTWASLQTQVYAFLDTLTEDDLSREITYPGHEGAARTMPLGQLIQHTANHSVHHRGQVALLIRMQGHPPGDFDMLFFFGERNGTIAW